MSFLPLYYEFEKNWNAKKNQLVWTRLAADLDTPVSLMLKLANRNHNSFLLESVTGGEARGRYSIIGMKPDLIWSCQGQHSKVNRNALDPKSRFQPLEGHPFHTLRALLAECKIDMPDDLPPASAGLFGYLGYDMIRLVENLPNQNPDHLKTPDAVLMRPSSIVVLDGVKGEVILIAPAWHSTPSLSAQEAYDKACSTLEETLQELEKPLKSTRHNLGNTNLSTTYPQEKPQEKPQPAKPIAIKSNFTKQDYKKAVEKAKEYIKAGEIFQVVPSQRWSRPFKLEPFALYRSLRRTNPSPFMFFFNFDGYQLIGASPEILVRLRDGEITIRPIAGTRPRGTTLQEDKAFEADLLADEKELAEHLMLLDLGRNDVGKVAQPGTVHPTEKFIIERYSHVMHIVSNVVGKIHPDEDALSALLAGLPAGTVSGAPKVRAMEIIDELEPEKRGIYGGGVGYFAANGEMDFCIALRTAVLKDKTLFIQAGGGVVHDSDPEAEWLESVNKSEALRRAADEAIFFSDE